MQDLQRLIPQNKSDTVAVERAMSAGYPAIEEILPALLEWIQDGNWPVAHLLIPFLAAIGDPMVPHIRDVLQGEDDVWKYWCLQVIATLPTSARLKLLPDLQRIVRFPTPGEVVEEVALEAEELLSRLDELDDPRRDGRRRR